MLNAISPFFIVDDLHESLHFYTLKLGFEVAFRGGDADPARHFWGIVTRDNVMLMLKAIAPGVHPQPNHTRHEYARWDAYVNTSDPDALYHEYLVHGVTMHRGLEDNSDGLRAFEILDNSGYVLCFGRPQ